MNTIAQLIEKLFERDILITPDQAKVLTERDVAILSDLIAFPREAEAYLSKLVSSGGTVSSAPPLATAQDLVAALPSVTAAAAAGATLTWSQPEAMPTPAPAPVAPPRPASTFIPVEVVRNYERKPKKRSYQDFVQHFTVRFQRVAQFLRARKELASILPIEKMKRASAPNEAVALVGMVVEKRETKNGHLMLVLEDRTATINVLFAKGKPDLLAIGMDVSLDDIIGITGKLGDNIVFADAVYFADIPMQHELKKSPDEVYAVCVSDIHFGNKNFMKEEFNTFLSWLAGESGGAEAKSIAAKTKYVIIPGDVIEGVGIYPSQEADLEIPDIYEQYHYCDSVLSKIPADKHVIIIPGNHDIGRLSEPQPRLPKEVLPLLSARPNTYFLSNPSIVRLHQKPGFSGFTVQLYHGGSFIYYGNEVPRLFREGGVNNPCSVMQYLLQRRHLAPAHASTLYVPDVDDDQLIIDDIPDFLITGHLHMAQQKTWRGITMLSCSCWVPITDYQQKQGLKCDPGKFVLINLQTRGVDLLTPADMIAEDA